MYTSSMPCGNACVRKWANGRKEIPLEMLTSLECPRGPHPTFHAHARKEGQIAPMWKREAEIDRLQEQRGVEAPEVVGEWCPAGVTFVHPRLDRHNASPEHSSSARTSRASPSPSTTALAGDVHKGASAPSLLFGSDSSSTSDSRSRRLLSCSDKIARWNVLGIQGKRMSHCMMPVYLRSITIGRKFNRPHAERALCCRLEACRPQRLHTALAALGESGGDGIHINHPTIMCTAVKLDDRVIESTDGAQFSSIQCYWWCRTGNRYEWLNGISGRTVEGEESELCTRQLSRTEHKAMMDCWHPGLDNQHQEPTCHHATREEPPPASYACARHWLNGKGGLLEHCST